MAQNRVKPGQKRCKWVKIGVKWGQNGSKRLTPILTHLHLVWPGLTLFCAILSYLEPFWAHLKHFRSLGTPLWRYFDPVYAVLAHVDTILTHFGHFWARLRRFEPFWPHVTPTLTHLHLGHILTCFDSFWAIWRLFEPIWSTLGALGPHFDGILAPLTPF